MADTVRYSAVGVYVANSDPVIKNGNIIEDNETGIKCDGGADPVIEWNTISSNDTCNIEILGGSDPDIGHASGGNSVGNNTITGSPKLIWNRNTSGTIMAESNWWGSDPPDTSKILGAVDYTPWDTTSPGPPPSPSSPYMDEREEDLKLPTRFALGHGYPNPFNPVMTIPYDVPPPGGLTRIVVYNIKGQVVRTLLQAEKTPGFYRLTWDGRSDRGGPVASGVYFVDMRARGFRATRKIVLLK